MSKWDILFKVDGTKREFEVFVGLWWLVVAAVAVALWVIL